MSETSTLIGYGGRTIGREELALVPTPPATETHRPCAAPRNRASIDRDAPVSGATSESFMMSMRSHPTA